MYHLFKYHNIMPSTFHSMGEGEKLIVKSFMDFEIDQIIEENKSLSKGGF